MDRGENSLVKVISQFQCKDMLTLKTYSVCTDPAGFFVTEDLGVGSVQLQHECVNKVSVHPQVWAQELGISLKLLKVEVTVWSRKI